MNRWLAVLMMWFACAVATAGELPQVMVMFNLPAPHFRADASYAGSYRSDAGRGSRRKIALELAEKFSMTLAGDWPMPVLGVDCYVFNLHADADPVQIAARLAEDRRVEWAQPVAHYQTLGAGDPLYAAQPAASQWHLSDLHRVATGRNVTVAVIDSGVDVTHPELVGQVAQHENFVDGTSYVAEAHGTAVAGIIAARADNGIGIRGIAPGSQVLALRACRESGSGAAQCDSFSLAKALNWAILREPRVINLSLGGPQDRLLQKLVDAALARHISVIAAVDARAPDGGFPASWPGVTAVSDVEGGRDAIVAPGHDVPAPLPGGRFGVLSGSSYAAAHVSGMLALVSELKPGLILRAKAGMPFDACSFVSSAAPHCVCSCPAATSKTALR